MAFQTPITIERAVEHIHQKKYVIPAIQREFVWSSDQITRLFDSLMRGYPIGSFLFWKVNKDNLRHYKFYGFLGNYHQRDNRHNKQIDMNGEEGITAVLDGQQRLTSLYIGLRGSYAIKIKGKRWTNSEAYPRRQLYLNLKQPSSGEEIGLKYDFRFLTDSEIQSQDTTHWFPVKEVRNFSNLRDINKYLRTHDLLEPEYPEECLCKLYEVMCQKPLVNYYEEEDQDLDKVLNIFIRVNSGGTELSYSDLLLSIATAQWTTIDARQAIHDLVDNLNRTGEGFKLNKDFVLKSCLVLANLPEIGFKVKNFTRENTQKIENDWQQISTALQQAVSLASHFGYSGFTLTANNALVPIAYYLLKRQLPAGYLQSKNFVDDREKIRKWITRALLKTGTFGSGLDTTLRTARSTIQAHSGAFPVQQMDTEFARIGKTLRFEEEELDDLLDRTYNKRGTFSVLALLYPGVDPSNRFHQDHIFPKARFTRRQLLEAGVPENQIHAFQERQDRIANLQLLEGISNQEKSTKIPAEWLREHCSSKESLDGWNRRNFTNSVPESIKDFIDFYETRREKMKIRLAEILGVTLNS